MANRFWVPGGSGYFNNTNNWSLTSGGSGGASVPTAGNVAVFDENSWAALSYTVNVDIDVLCDVNFAPAAGVETFFNGGGHDFQSVNIELSSVGEDVVTLSGSNTFSNLTITGKGAINFNGCSAETTQTISGELLFDGTLTLDDYDGDKEWTLSKESGTVTAYGCWIGHSVATGGATFTALSTNGNTNGGNNTGWVFDEMQSVSINDSILFGEEINNAWTLSGVNYFDQNTEDSLAAGDSESNNWNGQESISDESLSLADSSSFLITLAGNVIDAIFLYEELVHGWAVSNTESLVLSDTIAEVLGLVIDEWLTLTDAQTSNWNGREIIPDTLNLFDISQGAKKYADTIDESLVGADTALLKLTVSALEYLGFSDLVSALKTMAQGLSDGASLSDSSAVAYAAAIQEALSAVDSAALMTTFIGRISESLGLSDLSSLIKRVSPTATSSLVLAESISNKGTFYSAVYDTLSMNVTVELAGEVYECYVLNTPKFMPSMYSVFDFNSYCVFENRAFGANSVGIYELTGTTDAGATIRTGAVLSQTDFGAPNQKRFRRGYLGVSGTSPVMVLETEDGGRQAYSIDAEGKTVFSHDQKSKKWKLAIADFDELDSIKLIPVVLSK